MRSQQQQPPNPQDPRYQADPRNQQQRSQYPPGHRLSQTSSIVSQQSMQQQQREEQQRRYSERPVDVDKDPYRDLRNPRFQGLVPDPETPKQVPDSPRGSEVSKSDSMRRLQEWTKQQMSRSTSNSSFRQQQQQGQRQQGQGQGQNYFEPLTIDTSPQHNAGANQNQQYSDRRRSQATSSTRSSGNRPHSGHGSSSNQNDASPGRPPIPSEYRSQYAAQIAESATPNTRRDILTASQTEAKRRDGEPLYFRYPEVRSEQRDEDDEREREIEARDNDAGRKQVTSLCIISHGPAAA